MVRANERERGSSVGMSSGFGRGVRDMFCLGFSTWVERESNPACCVNQLQR